MFTALVILMISKNMVMIESFDGINQSIDKQSIKESFAYRCENCDIDTGTLKRSKGTTLSNITSIPIITLIPYYHGNTFDVLCSDTTDVYKVGTGTPIVAMMNSGKYDYVNYQYNETEIVVFTNGKDAPQVYNGLNVRPLYNRWAVTDETGKILYWTDTTATHYDNKADARGESPKGNIIELHKERLWIAGSDTDSNAVYFSKDYDPDDWSVPVTEEEANHHGGKIDLPSWDSNGIIAMKSLFNDLMIFKKNSVFKIFGSAPENFEVQQVFNTSNGEIIDKTISCTQNEIYFLSKNGIFVSNGSTIANITAPIKEYFKDINQAYISGAVSTVFKDKLIIAVPYMSSSVNNMLIIYDTITKKYTIKLGYGIVDMINCFDYLLIADYDGRIYKYDNGDSINGTSITSHYESGDLTVVGLNAKKIFDKVYLVAKGNGTINISLTNEKGKTKTINIVLTATFTTFRKRLRNKGRIIKISIDNVNGCDFEIKQPQFILDCDID